MIKNLKNEGVVDRLIRLLVAEILLLTAFFWLDGVSQIFVYVLGLISLFTSISGFCALYKVFGIKTILENPKKTSVYIKVIFALLFVLIAVLGSYYSAFLSKKFFLDDYTKMNNYYKQTLFFTGQINRDEAVKNYSKLVEEYSSFSKKYTKYHPYVIRMDEKFNSDLESINKIISSVKDLVSTGDLKQAHLDLESVRPIFQDILKRNNFSMLAITLVDFHDAMEKIISSADNKDAEGLIAVYPEVDLKLKAVEEITNDDEIKNIRVKLDETLDLAKSGKKDELSAKAAELKSAFVKVYLKRG